MSVYRVTQIKLENVSAKNVQGNAHAPRAFHPQLCRGTQGTVPPGGKRGAVNAPKDRLRQCPHAGPFQEPAVFQRREWHPSTGEPGPRSLAGSSPRGLQPARGKEATGTQRGPPREPAPQKWLCWRVAQKHSQPLSNDVISPCSPNAS